MDDYLDQLIQQLGKVGFLNFLQAQVRASVFRVVDNKDYQKGGLQCNNPLAQTIPSTEKGMIAIQLFQDFLSHFMADQTLSVFLPEAGIDESKNIVGLNKDFIAKKLQLDANAQNPLLFQLIERQQALKSNQPSARQKQSKNPIKVQFQEELEIKNQGKVGNQNPKQNEKKDKRKQVQTEQKKSKNLLSNIQRFQQQSLELEDLEENNISEEEVVEEFQEQENMNEHQKAIFESAGSQSYGPDPSVGSQVLEDYDYIENVLPAK